VLLSFVLLRAENLTLREAVLSCAACRGDHCDDYFLVSAWTRAIKTRLGTRFGAGFKEQALFSSSEARKASLREDTVSLALAAPQPSLDCRSLRKPAKRALAAQRSAAHQRQRGSAARRMQCRQ
jgi:hypothetical protein